MASSTSSIHDNDDMALYYQIYSPKAGKSSIDPRMINLLEYFRELCDRKRVLFRKIFPRSSDELVEFFKNIGETVSSVRSNQRMKRSTSLGSTTTGTREIKGGVSLLRPERFKIKTVVVNDVGDDHDHTSSGGQGDTKSGGSK
ncbi:hypothetical protein Dsin_000328 [Dipteronia sinensis]|uniref:Uncharacterized protein n=1 Tax=Dipteronia sinensis TaxID=43782 RepID=A0AAE0B313_9ROSI|nr:hypothetical protein Dsin_000328 [Dipteronia sinensis]